MAFPCHQALKIPANLRIVEVLGHAQGVEVLEGQCGPQFIFKGLACLSAARRKPPSQHRENTRCLGTNRETAPSCQAAVVLRPRTAPAATQIADTAATLMPLMPVLLLLVVPRRWEGTWLHEGPR